MFSDFAGEWLRNTSKVASSEAASVRIWLAVLFFSTVAVAAFCVTYASVSSACQAVPAERPASLSRPRRIKVTASST